MMMSVMAFIKTPPQVPPQLPQHQLPLLLVRAPQLPQYFASAGRGCPHVGHVDVASSAAASPVAAGSSSPALLSPLLPWAFKASASRLPTGTSKSSPRCAWTSVSNWLGSALCFTFAIGGCTPQEQRELGCPSAFANTMQAATPHNKGGALVNVRWMHARRWREEVCMHTPSPAWRDASSQS